jgi:hypothetical protein
MRARLRAAGKRLQGDTALALRLLAIGGLLTLLSFLVVQNSVVINVRLAYFIGRLSEVEMRVGTALLIAGGIGFLIGLLVGWRR